MQSRRLFLVWIFTLTILTTQSHTIHKRGLLSKLFGGDSHSTEDIDGDMSSHERSKFRQLLKNPVVISMLTAAVGMAVQRALDSRNMDNICENKYVKMAYSVSNMSPQMHQALKLLGCDESSQKYGNNDNDGDKYGSVDKDKEDAERRNDADEWDDDDRWDDESKDENRQETLESGFPSQEPSKLQQLLNIARGEKGAKRQFFKSLFGFGKKDNQIQRGDKLPSSSYRIDKDDANAMSNFAKEIEQYDKMID